MDMAGLCWDGECVVGYERQSTVKFALDTPFVIVWPPLVAALCTYPLAPPPKMCLSCWMMGALIVGAFNLWKQRKLIEEKSDENPID